MADTFPRINGGMIQSGQFTGQLVSLVGKLVSHDKIQAADGTVVTLVTDQMNEQPIVNPDMVVEIMGQPSDETTFTVRSTAVLLVVNVVVWWLWSGVTVFFFPMFLFRQVVVVGPVFGLSMFLVG